MIHIYGSANCAWCERAKQLAQNYNLEYRYYDVYKHKEQFLDLFPGKKTVPQITWNGRYIGGYDEFAAEVVNTIGGYGEGKL